VEPTIYDKAFTEIVNTVHECSRITEGLEGKTVLLSDDSAKPEQPVDPTKVEEDRPPRGTTPLARSLEEVFQYVEKLRQRLDKVEQGLIIDAR